LFLLPAFRPLPKWLPGANGLPRLQVASSSMSFSNLRPTLPSTKLVCIGIQ
jgi:hypothetical protein